MEHQFKNPRPKKFAFLFVILVLFFNLVTLNGFYNLVNNVLDGEYIFAGDMDQDGIVNILDVVILVNIILD